MRLVELHVENFRGIRSATLDCGDLTALVGRNGAGKSTFLHALSLFYQPKASISLEDFYNRSPEKPVVIRATFDSLRDDERDEFVAYLDEGRLSVTRRFPPPEPGADSQGEYFAARNQYPPFAEIRPRSKSDRKTEAAEIAAKLVANSTIPESPKIKSASDADAWMDAFEKEHPELLERIEDKQQFFGDKNVGGGKLDNFTQFVYIPAVRDAGQETGDKGTSFFQLVDIAVLRRINSRPEVANLQQKLKELINTAYQPSVVRAELDVLEGNLNAVLRSFVPEAALALAWSGDPTVNFQPPKVIPSVTEDSFAGQIARKGHGLQRAVIFTLLSHLARMKNVPTDQPNENHDETPRGSSGGVAPVNSPRLAPDLIIGIEEPELYQHPNRCRHFASVLRQLATSANGGRDARTQILLTTHSPYFVSLEHFDEIRLARKTPGGNGDPGHTTLTARKADDFRKQWAELCGMDPADITTGSMLARLLRTMTSLVNEGFFAEALVLVEGAGDVGALTAVAAQVGAGWLKNGVSVLAVEGKENLSAPILIFQELGIPTYFVFDGDDQLRGKGKKENEQQTKAANRRLLNLGGASISASFDGFPPDTAVDRFSCFSNHLEGSCRSDVGDEVFEATAAKVAEEIGWKVEDVLKCGRGAQRFVEEIYAAGKTLPFLEEVVERISRFAATTAAAASQTPAAATGTPATP